LNGENHITVRASRNAARVTGAGVFAAAVEFADLTGPNSQRLVKSGKACRALSR